MVRHSKVRKQRFDLNQAELSGPGACGHDGHGNNNHRDLE
jgi:hypothetical protein